MGGDAVRHSQELANDTQGRPMAFQVVVILTALLACKGLR